MNDTEQATSRRLSAAQRNNQLIQSRQQALFSEDADADMIRDLGKAVIDTDKALIEFLEESGWYGSRGVKSRLVRSIRALQAEADKAYEWHVGEKIPREEDED